MIALGLSKQKLIQFDNKITFVIGYRNLYNFVVMMIAAMSFYYAEVLVASELYMLALILAVLSCKWFLVQVRDNVDSLDVVDAISSERASYDEPVVSDKIIQV
jgi:hypothetical protein